MAKDNVGSRISQAQSTSGEPSQSEQAPEESVKKAGSESAESGTGAEVQHFDGTIVKIDADGNEVMSDYVGPGEKLRRESTERYSAVRPSKS